MFRTIKSAILAAGIVLAGAQAAKADVILTFNQDGPIMQQPIFGPLVGARVNFSLVLTDEAFASGVDWSLRSLGGPSGGPNRWALDGLLQIYLRTSGLSDPFSVNVWDLQYPSTIGVGSTARLNISSSAGALPVGAINYTYAGNITLGLLFNGTNMVSGEIHGDGVCFQGCTFNGTFVQSVPEPATILTFGIGLLGLAGVTRYRRA